MKKSKGKCLIWLGLLLMAAALCLTGYNVWDAFRAEKSVRQTADRLEALISPAPEPQPENTLPEEILYPDYVLNPEMEMPEEDVDGVDYIGTLGIPVLGLELPIISRWSYPSLKLAPCRVHRLGVPGRSGHRSPQLREPLRAAEGAGPRR